ncbi:hypothetical protein Terro_1664 [Terriglobus roseus DSM 18391]|uniref:Uncharacterized protein n=1 Tax=Terriglobus roseus (strain DSM 18391 / NRRL B-41598 / KBS 63) TaxID=926566 RepID=I3ZFE9_TERRK|nr:hypothetical protein [Terriglobus roseus]AFL87967.1 hypothetical protein Terro_1664 [Terriglobus roseus DSM 18391]
MNRFAHTLTIGLIASLLAAPLTAQTIAPPTTGLLVQYQYWPVQYVQWIGTELPYSMIELDVDATAKQPLYNVILTDRSSGKRIVYANSDALVANAKAQGEEAYQTQIAFDAPETTNVGATSTLRLSLVDGKPLQWRFVQGSDISEQGAGLTPLPQVPVPVLAYREQAAVAGEGTALQIGDKVSTAEVWTEISKPPYFVAYHGAISLSAHMTVLVPGKQTWTVVSAPTDLKAGQSWELDGDHGNHRTLRITRVEGSKFVITGSDRFATRTAFTMDCKRTGDSWSIDRVRFAPAVDGEKHFLAMTFTVPLTGSSAASTVDISVGRKAKVASANLALSGSQEDRTVTLRMQTPTWARGKGLIEETTTDAATLTTVSKLSH